MEHTNERRTGLGDAPPRLGEAPVDVTRHDAASGGPRVFKEDLHGSEHRAFPAVLSEAVTGLEEAQIPYVVIGGIACSRYGRPRWTHDIDIMIRPEEAEAAVELLAARGFETERTDTRWIYKALKRNVMVDLIFRPAGGMYLDDEMVGRAIDKSFFGHTVKFIPPEDLLVMKAVVHDEGSPRHWHDALAIIAETTIDWDYLMRRAARAPRRVLALLIYAHSLDLLVPNRVITAVHDRIYRS
jgi:hypothetical protein